MIIGPLTIICGYLAGTPCLNYLFGPLSVLAMYYDALFAGVGLG